MSDDDRYKELFNRAHEAVMGAADARKSKIFAKSAFLVSMLTLAVAFAGLPEVMTHSDPRRRSQVSNEVRQRNFACDGCDRTTRRATHRKPVKPSRAKYFCFPEAQLNV
ncbi:hypothetical protein MTX26_20960 [Bradyrhizobium sp. ISRA443]|uniref:hypothetical protein n=1 Tax=unclassified Bradyrhizobium TaxID=2631580 RepID=UPI00247A31C8|nr:MULTISPECIES: hypothetical protein [unclassified Bradyrhizobium]WGR92520.1 hypothetical protein MTX20_31665 [Bradyrhizobium sp. ISRA435]WGR96921.1 hypothetical protein MTX23_20960 [Bradyrhizobium sp. ISRA436]WGS03808.1 hypothetical protein MTX18_20960 [Bradyrhizobium sp. ISRA437]WGS10692.1 hypothetical protein MTX26_20960 [Bradyrhizobium sp. ISRA443]